MKYSFPFHKDARLYLSTWFSRAGLMTALRSLLIISMFICCYQGHASAATLEVPSEFPTIQDAVSQAGPHDTIIVAPGRYRLFFEGLIIINTHLTLRSSNGAPETVITGRGNRPVITIGQDSQVVIEGFTITTETDSPAVSTLGGGIYCSAGSAPVIKKNIITGNHAVFGAGIYCDVQSSPVITGNVFLNNRADTAGGGIFADHARAVIAKNRFHENCAVSSGGALECNRDSSIIANNIFWKNSAAFGGAISCDRAANMIYNNTIADNQGRKAAGIMIDRGSVRLANLIFMGNMHGDFLLNGTGPAARPVFSDIQDKSYAGINGNIAQDPMFINPAQGNFHLGQGSPCIDKGNHDPFYMDKDNSFNDMGAYGGPDPINDESIPFTPLTKKYGVP